jgi:VCBS repeat-containing protein
VTINEDTSVHANVLTNDSDPDGDTLSVTDFTINGVTHPTGSDSVIIAGVGSFRMDSGGNYSFTPVLDWNGTVPTIGYTVADSDGATDTAELKISVTPVNDAPVIQGGHQSGAVVEAGNLDDGTVVAGTVSASGQFTATDVDSGTLTWSRIGAADTSYGTFNINSATGAWTYALNNALPATQALKENETKTLTYQVQVSDGAGGTATRDVVITITGTNDSPVAVADIGSVVEAGVQNGGNTATAGTGTAAANVLTNDSDVDAGEKATLQVSAVSFGGTPGTVGSVLSATYGTFVLNANGSYTYTLQNDWAATQALKQGDTVTEIFSYTAVDVNGATSQSTLTITVTGTNDRPVITSAPSAATGEVTEQGTGNPAEPNTATGTLTAVDPDSGATLTWNVIGSNNGTYGTISINPATGAWIYSLDNGRLATQALNNNDTKVDKFTVRVTDEHGASREQEIAVTVHGSNDNLTGTLPGTPIAVTEDVEKTGTLQTYISDVDDNAATIKVTGFQVDANGDGTNESYAPGAAVTLTDAAGNAIGTLIIAENGDYSFNPHANYSGNVPPVTFTMADSGGATVTQTLTFAIKPVSDAPVLTPVADITTNEDTAVALGLHAPAIADTGTLSPGASNDYSERLGTITLTIGGAGANGVTLSTGATVLTPVNDLVHIILTDVPHVLDAPPANPANGVYHMTAAQYEALMANPAPESGKNFTVAVTARSFEVDGTGAIRPTVPGATSTQTVNVDVRAVTDGATLTSDRTSVTFPEDASLYLTGLLTAALADSDGHPGDDTDGSETYWYSIGGLPVGTVITIDGTATEITSAGMVVSSPVSPSATPPAINIKPPLNFSGDMKGVTVTLNSQDTDSDSSHTPAVITSPVTLDLYVSPVAGDISVGSGIVSTNEDTAVAFLKDVTVTDTSAGNEIITSVSFTVPSGWTVTPPTSSPGWSYGLSGTLTQIIFASNPALTEAQREAVLDGFLIKPPANSSKDVDITLTIRTSDTNMVNGSTVTATSALNRTVKIVVDPVAERTDGDSNANGTPDAAMIGSHVYSVAGEEDAWFALGTTYTGAANTGGGADLLTGWSNEDADEFTYAVLTPTLGGAAPGDSIIGAQFRFSTDGGATWQTRTYAGDAVWVPRQYLDTLQVKLPPDVTGTLTVQVQAGTVDYDDDAEQLVLPLDPPHVSGAGVNVQVSGSATLSTIQFTPVADPVTMALNGRAVGKEDTAIPLAIKVTSSDSSESFNVTLSQIPTGAKVIYGGTEQTVVGGAVTIANFDNSVPMTITPPPDSNQNFALKVSAVSVDGSDTSAPVERSINVSVSGVADTAIVTPMMDPAISEAYVDASGHKVALSAMLASVTSPDVDGSEAVTLRISGLAPDFSIAGATVVVAGSGTERVWMVPANKLADVSIVLPANYSGKVELEVAGVTTENDGDSLTGAPVPLSLTVTPSPEATINDSAMLVEDEVTALNLSIIHRNGDTDEALGHIYIVADYAAGAQYALYLGGTALESAGVGPTTLTDVPGLPNGDYYVLTASQIGQLGAKGAPHLDGGLGSLPLFYEIIDPSGDTTPATSEILLGSVALTAMPITDAVDATITAITVNAGVGSTADIVPGGDAVPDTATMNSSGALTVRLHVDSADSDGSEHLIRVLIGGVPDGVTVTGAAQLGGGQWLLVYDGAAAKSIGAGGIDLPVEFVVGKGTANGGSNITMTVLAQDEGQSATPAATIETDTVGWRLEVALTDGQPLPPPSVTLVYNGAEGVEDIAFALGDMLDATAVIPNASLAYNYTITVTGLPEGTVVDGMVLTSIGGAPVWTAAVTVPANGDSQAAIDALLDSIHITAPANSNDNHGPFHFDARLTGSAVGGVSVSDSTDATVPIAPQTDAASVTVTTSNVGEGETSVTATITAQDVIDGSFGRIVGDTLYVRVTTAGNPGGTVTDGAGNILSPTSVSGVDGVADGDYFVITLPASGDGVQLTYTADGTLNPGDVVFTAWARTQEDNAANIVTGSGTATARVLVVNNGVTVTSSDVTASEPSSSNPQDAIQLTGLSVALNDDDGSEAIHSILLSGLPVGFLLYVGSSAGSAEAAAPASNAGGDGNTNTWVLSATGELPAYVAILPPSYWSGTLEHLKLVVESGESSLTPLVQVIDLGVLTVEAVANGLTIDPSLSFGIEGHIIDINLNAAMVNAGTATASLPDSSTETTTLQISGLGQYAAFYIGNTLLTSVSYDEGGDVYTITGLRQSALDQLGFVQAASATPAQVSVTAWTVETDNGHESAKVTGTLTLDVAPVLATTGNDHFIWDGVTAINGRAGEDTVALRHGEDVTHGDLAARLSNVEVIDLSSPGANSIAGTGGLTIDDVLKITGASDGKLTIDGDGEDSVLLSNEWSTTGPATDGHLLYTNTTSGITLSIDEDIHVSYAA